MWQPEVLPGTVFIVGGNDQLESPTTESYIKIMKENENLKLVGNICMQSTPKNFLFIDNVFQSKNEEVDQFMNTFFNAGSILKFTNVIIACQSTKNIPSCFLPDYILYKIKNGFDIVDKGIECGYQVLHDIKKDVYTFQKSSQLLQEKKDVYTFQKSSQLLQEKKETSLPTFKLLDLKGIVIIIGKRQTGKTTLLKRLSSRNNSIFITHNDEKPTLETLFEKDYVIVDDYGNNSSNDFKDLINKYAQHSRSNLVIAVQSMRAIPVSIRASVDYLLFTSKGFGSENFHDNITFDHKVMLDVNHDKYFIID